MAASLRVQRFPGHVVCERLGNSLAIAREHYLQVTEDHYRLAATQNPTHPTANCVEQRKTSKGGKLEKTRGKVAWSRL